MSVIMHVDMDAFYASVHMATNPDLRHVSMYVVDVSGRVVVSANYLARARGVSAGMSARHARQLAPAAVVIPADMERYEQVSQSIQEIFFTLTNRVQIASIDEAFIDVTGTSSRLGSPARVGQMLRDRIADEQHISASVGIAPSLLVAKIASTQAKPDGMIIVEPDDVVAFLHPLPVSKLWGVGRATTEKLHALGIRRISDIAYLPRSVLRRAVGDHVGNQLADFAWGRDQRVIIPREPQKSVGAQTTLVRPTVQASVVSTELLRLSGQVAFRMRQAGVLARGVTLTLGFADYTRLSRSSKYQDPTDVTDDLYAQAWTMYQRLHLQRAQVRLLSLRATHLIDADHAYQQPVLGQPEKGMREAEQALDELARRFGHEVVVRARLASHAGLG